MKRALLAAALTLLLAPAAQAFNATGRFLYEDRLYDGNGYTGQVQNLPIRRARVEIVHAATQLVLGSGVTDGDGYYTVAVDGQTLPVSCYARCITDGRPAGYHIRVYDNFVRDIVNGRLLLAGSTFYSIMTSPVLNHPPAEDLAFGTFLTQDTDGMGVAQAFNIFDNGVDFFDWMAQPGLLGSLPAEADSIVYAWKATGTPGNPPPVFGSNYSLQGVFIGAELNADTDGWSDTVILHETGHWYDDVFSRSDNPGGAHYIGDNDANVLLSYGEGAATFHCGKVREHRATTRMNLVGQPVDQLVSLYADLTLPPAVGTPGGLSFSYDFETGNYGNTGAPIGQRGSANETNVTSALWDMVDGGSSPDATPGVDDESLEVSDQLAWGIEHTYLPSVPPANAITVEDYWQGWFALNGPGAQLAGMQQVFVGNALMPFIADSAEPDNGLVGAPAITPIAYTTSPTGKVVISEIHMGPLDAMELYNGSDAAVDLTGWQLEVFANGTTQDPTRIYTFPPFTLQAGEFVTVHEAGSQLDNGQRHLYAGDQQAFNASWNNGVDGACLLRNTQGTAIDFLRWRDAFGVPSSAPVPAGTAFTGTLDSPPAPFNLARDVSGTDSDDAADWTGRPGTLSSANHPAPIARTIFGSGDVDVFAFTALPGARYGFEARGPFSATDPMLELLGANGQVLGSNDDSEATVRDARLDFFAAQGGTYYIRVQHVGTDTEWGEYELLAFERPGSAPLAAPSSASADAENTTDTQDAVTLTWLNAAAYDSVAVYRDSTVVARLAGAPSTFTDHADRGVYRYEVSGFLGGAESNRARVFAFAGVVGCESGDDFESGAAAKWITDGTSWGTMAGLAADGAFSFTDSPAGPYGGCHGVLEGCGLEFIATLGIPADLPWGSKLDFDHICITEAGFDYGIVELSANGGQSWVEIARYDQSHDARWGDNAAGPTDWRHETIDLAPWVGQRVMIRFKLTSDPLIELDGWYVDNVRVNPVACHLLSANGPGAPKLAFHRPSPNPARGPARLRFVLPATEDKVEMTVHDVQGRAQRTVSLGPLSAGEHAWTWDGRDDGGRTLPSGAYFMRLQVGSKALTQKLLKLAH